MVQHVKQYENISQAVWFINFLHMFSTNKVTSENLKSSNVKVQHIKMPLTMYFFQFCPSIANKINKAALDHLVVWQIPMSMTEKVVIVI